VRRVDDTGVDGVATPPPPPSTGVLGDAADSKGPMAAAAAAAAAASLRRPLLMVDERFISCSLLYEEGWMGWICKGVDLFENAWQRAGRLSWVWGVYIFT
jgi:hypothetical protein